MRKLLRCTQVLYRLALHLFCGTDLSEQAWIFLYPLASLCELYSKVLGRIQGFWATQQESVAFVS